MSCLILCRRWTVPGRGHEVVSRSPQNNQAATFARTFTGAQVARAVKPAGYTSEGWRTSRSKVLDNAIISYCKLNRIEPVRT